MYQKFRSTEASAKIGRNKVKISKTKPQNKMVKKITLPNMETTIIIIKRKIQDFKKPSI